jgi:hypothetical protein
MLTTGVQPLHKAARQGWLEAVRYLVAKGADVTATNILGQTPRQEAESAAKSLKGLSDPTTDQRYAAVMTFLDNAAAGGADLDRRVERGRRLT